MLGSGGVLGEGKQIVPPGTMDLHSGITTPLADHRCGPWWAAPPFLKSLFVVENSHCAFAFQ